MAISFVSVLGSDTVTGTTDRNLAIDVTGVSDGDLMVFVVSTLGRYFSLSGWTELFHTASGFQVLYRIASSDTGTKTFTTGFDYSYATGVILRFSGANAPDVYGSEVYDSAWDSTFSCPNITPSAAGSTVVWIGCSNGSTTTSNRGTERFDNIGTNNLSLSVYTEADLAASLQTGAVLACTAVNNKFACAFSIPPAAAAGPVIPVFMNQYRQRVA